jgi:hypothetical protein
VELAAVAASGDAVENERRAEREQIEREQPEHPAGPEAAQRVVALERRGDDEAAAEEEQHDPELSGPEHVIVEMAVGMPQALGAVLECDRQRSEPAQRVEELEPPRRRRRRPDFGRPDARHRYPS